MIVKNEERQLRACLDSVRGVVSEIVVVDTGSVDGTARVAGEYGAQVAPFDFSFVDFSAARNFSISRATGDWIFVLDADESLVQESVSELREIVARGENAGYYVGRDNDLADRTVDYAVRLFPNRPEYRYRGRVHETITGSKLRRSGIRIDHRFTSDPEQRRRKNHWYIAILLEEIAAHPEDDSHLDFLAAEYHQLGMFHEAAAVAERIVLARPHDPTAHLNAGIYHLLYVSNPTQARADFTRALELRPNYLEAQSFLETMDTT